MSFFHAHVEIETADCDGRFSRTYISRPREDQHDEEFRQFQISLRSGADVSIHGDHVVFHDETEEGYSHTELTFCKDLCDDRNRQRDYRAEAAGY